MTTSIFDTGGIAWIGSPELQVISVFGIRFRCLVTIGPTKNVGVRNCFDLAGYKNRNRILMALEKRLHVVKC